MDISKIPLSPVVQHNDLLFLSGQLGFTSPGVLVEGGIEAQTRQAIANIETVLAANGSDLSQIIKSTIWLTRKSDFPAFNTVYASHFEPGCYPARSTVVSDLLIDGALVEIEVIARKTS
jgi:2-iminobutanoate/2-iminopropanoate deaminase